MAFKSPLRYPGGKTRAIRILETYIPADKDVIVSPFLGGGSFELHCSSKGMTVLANDLFRPLYIFWKVLKENPEELQKMVQDEIPVTKEKFSKYRREIMNMTNDLEIATAYYIVNRCSFSGSTFCGGFSQQASSGRLNQAAIDRLTNVSMDKFTLSNVDCNEFLDGIPETDSMVIYADPPYYIGTYVYGKDGDMHEGFDHILFATQIKKRKSWVLSYNDCRFIRDLYSDCKIDSVRWSYGMSIKPSSEIVITPRIPGGDA